MTTLQLNPDTSDGFEAYTLAEMRQMVFDEIGFMSFDDSNNLWTVAMIRSLIINRLGLAVALVANFDTFDNILTDVYNAGGYASIGATHPPGVDNLLGTIINNAQRTLFARIEFDKGGASNPPLLTTGVSTTIDATAVRMLAIAELKAHQQKPDAAGYAQQAEKYLSDLTQRTPPNIIGVLNSAIADAHEIVFRRWEMGQTSYTFTRNTLGTLFMQAAGASDPSKYATKTFDALTTSVDSQPVILLAMANVKQKIGQPDAEAYYKQYEQYMADRIKRLPPNAAIIVNRALKDAQETLYRRYSVFRMERWYTWTTVADQRFYPLYGYDGAISVAPTAVLAVQGAAVTSHFLAVARANTVQTVMRDGRVMVIGGAGQTDTTTEIYDPATGVFSEAAPTLHPRDSAAGCLLSDGRVFVVGGYPYLASSEIYDPSTDQWTLGPNLTYGRYLHTCALLSDGTVLVAGGGTPGVGTSAKAELYDPRGNTFTSVGDMTVGRDDAQAILLANGKVLVVGGCDNAAHGIASSDLYDPVTKTFSSVAMAFGHFQSSAQGYSGAALMFDGRIIVVAGIGTGGSASTNCEIYDPNTNAFTTIAPISVQRINHRLAALNDGRVILFGGNFGASYYTTSEIYDPVANTWSAGPATPGTILYGGHVLLQDGRVLAFGGAANNVTLAQKTAFTYDPQLNSFSLTGSLTQGTTYYVVTAETATGESLPSLEANVTAVPANTGVNLSWTPVPKQPFVKWFRIYRGKTIGGEGFIARVTSDKTSYFDQGTIPQGVAPPTENTTVSPTSRQIDPRHIAWVGLSLNGNVWNPLIAGIPPIAYTANISGIPTNYEIRNAIELWPPPRDNTWQLQVKGYFPPQIFESDDDTTTIDWQAILYQTVADVLPKFPGRYDKETIADARRRSDGYIKELTAGTHVTRRYIPGSATQRNLIRPVFTGTFETYP